jgi:hypothetical protein
MVNHSSRCIGKENKQDKRQKYVAKLVSKRRGSKGRSEEMDDGTRVSDRDEACREMKQSVSQGDYKYQVVME